MRTSSETRSQSTHIAPHATPARRFPIVVRAHKRHRNRQPPIHNGPIHNGPIHNGPIHGEMFHVKHFQPKEQRPNRAPKRAPQTGNPREESKRNPSVSRETFRQDKAGRQDGWRGTQGFARGGCARSAPAGSEPVPSHVGGATCDHARCRLTWGDTERSGWGAVGGVTFRGASEAHPCGGGLSPSVGGATFGGASGIVSRETIPHEHSVQQEGTGRAAGRGGQRKDVSRETFPHEQGRRCLIPIKLHRWEARAQGSNESRSVSRETFPAGRAAPSRAPRTGNPRGGARRNPSVSRETFPGRTVSRSNANVSRETFPAGRGGRAADEERGDSHGEDARERRTPVARRHVRLAPLRTERASTRNAPPQEQGWRAPACGRGHTRLREMSPDVGRHGALGARRCGRGHIRGCVRNVSRETFRTGRAAP